MTLVVLDVGLMKNLLTILRRCPSSFMIWNKLGTHPPSSSFWTLPLCEWIMNNLSTSHANNESNDVRHNIMVTPPDGWVMLNIDGASRGNPGDAGGGGILRDDRRRFIRAFAENYGKCTVMRSELLAFMRGITMARDMGIKKLFFKVDSQVVVQFME
ncbi:LURP1-like domain-containing protein [Tanacetum coccineum]